MTALVAAQTCMGGEGHVNTPLRLRGIQFTLVAVTDTISSHPTSHAPLIQPLLQHKGQVSRERGWTHKMVGGPWHAATARARG